MEQTLVREMPGEPATLPKRRTLLAYLPFLWTRVLFPVASGQAASAGKAWLFLLLLPSALLYPCMSFHLFEPDEGRYAEIPREMLARGEWVVPYLQSEPYLDKPPLFYWLVMLSYRCLGVHAWSARLVPALAVHGCVLLTYFLGRRSLGERAAFWGALALTLAPGFVCMGKLLILDGLLALCVTLALLSGFEAVRGTRLKRGWWLLSAFACGLGILAKGPVALLLAGPPLLLHRWLTATPGRLAARDWLTYLLVLVATMAPWYGAMFVSHPSFAAYFLWEHNIVRFLSPFDHLRPVWFYLPILAIGLLPASLLALPFGRFLFSGDPACVERRSPELGFMLLAGWWCVLFFSLSGCKLPTYILPAFPPLALAMGCFISGTRWCHTRWLHAAVGVALLLLGLVNYGFMPRYARFHSPMAEAEEVARYCGDPAVPVVCYPRNCDSVSFYLARADFRSYRSKQTPTMIRFLQEQPRTVILFTHRHSLEGLRQVLPPDLRLIEEVPLSGSWRSARKPEMCYMAVVERTR